jgi:hypothetical protein
MYLIFVQQVCDVMDNHPFITITCKLCNQKKKWKELKQTNIKHKNRKDKRTEECISIDKKRAGKKDVSTRQILVDTQLDIREDTHTHTHTHAHAQIDR